MHSQATALTSVTIPDSVTSIGFNAFASDNLSSVYFRGNAPSADFSMFSPARPARPSIICPRTTGWDNFSADSWRPDHTLACRRRRLAMPVLACGRTNSGSTSPGPVARRSWWKPAQIYTIPSGLPIPPPTTLAGDSVLFQRSAIVKLSRPLLPPPLAVGK